MTIRALPRTSLCSANAAPFCHLPSAVAADVFASLKRRVIAQRIGHAGSNPRSGENRVAGPGGRLNRDADGEARGRVDHGTTLIDTPSRGLVHDRVGPVLARRASAQKARVEESALRCRELTSPREALLIVIFQRARNPASRWMPS